MYPLFSLLQLTSPCQVISGDPDNVEAKMKLAELYEAMDEPRKALNLVYEGIVARITEETLS